MYTTPYRIAPPYGMIPPEEQQRRWEQRSLHRRGVGIGLALLGMPALSAALGALGTLVLGLCGIMQDRYGAEYLYLPPHIYYIYYMALYLSMVVLPFLALALIFRLRPGEAFPARRTAHSGLVMLACVGGLSVCMMADLLNSVFSGVMETVFGLTNVGASLPLADDGLSRVLYFCIFAILPPLAEEFAFRGVVLGLLRPYGKTLAIVGSAFVFAIMHGTMAQIPFAFVGGLFFGYLAAETGSIWPSVAVHFLNNALSVAQQFVLTDCPETTATHILYLTYIVATLLGLIALVLVLRRDRHFFRAAEDRVTLLNNREKFRAFAVNAGMILAYVVVAIETVTSVQIA